MTTTNIVVNQSIGTGGNVGTGKFPTKVTLDTGTSAAVLTLRVTNGTIGLRATRCVIDLWYSFSPVDVSAAAGVELLNQNARYVSLKGADNASDDRAKDSLIEPVTGQFLYLWFDIAKLPAAAVLNAYVTEI